MIVDGTGVKQAFSAAWLGFVHCPVMTDEGAPIDLTGNLKFPQERPRRR
ncbi:hypothetical protein C4K37_3652 [Pseudomonas chlororaphis subsp. piscium]|nr:hypothetical protein C4K37_3652 [Pseudomonas chlororaphis subsp. piscium]AZC44583.1 hypothetical protein C4K36_3660 [Pseudomonas chlororaphis subsp. piscium]AZC89957.1 hypothetical protein C4K29_3658 [Pseudomonas chlororaphis subsp. piscium]AZC96329.1 hypothetical protein C4K28_3603 [Pseudomonas chlororaphis subsp. piscium]